MAFTDKVTIRLCAGNGGDGVVRWRREKYIPKGGPAGGDGGRGGSVYIEGVKDNSRLQYYAGKDILRAENGQSGAAKSLYGKNGDDLILPVPIGTIVTNLHSQESFDVLDEEKILVLKGGEGGLGNIHFKSSTNQAPRQQTDGQEGQCADFEFELRLIADAGLIGLPSAGKSSLLNFLTNARSKVAEYDFTTLEPHLGTFYEFVLADIPGLIEGASSGKGLGHKFLQHISRTKVLLHCISLESEDLRSNYEVIRRELENFDENLVNKKEQIILTKSDMMTAADIEKARGIFPNAWVVSVLDDDQLKSLSDKLVKLLREA